MHALSRIAVARALIRPLGIINLTALFRPQCALVRRIKSYSINSYRNPPATFYHQQRYLASMSSDAEAPNPVVGEPSTAAEDIAETKPALPPLSAHEFKQYNRLADHMDYFVRPPLSPPPLYIIYLFIQKKKEPYYSLTWSGFFSLLLFI